MKYIASVSFGKDSLAMLLRLLEEGAPLDEVIFYDTGMEFNSIYKIRDLIIKKLSENIAEGGVKFTQLSSENTFLYNMFVRPVRYNNPETKDYPMHYGYEWCGGNARWGTSGKLAAIRKHYRDNYPGEQIFEYVGIAADEPKRIRTHSHGDAIKIYPLVNWNMTEADCLQYCYDHGFNWDENGIELYDVLDRVSCWCCRNKNLKELKNIFLYLPEYWQRLRGLQSRIKSPMKGVGKSVFELEERFTKEME